MQKFLEVSLPESRFLIVWTSVWLNAIYAVNLNQKDYYYHYYYHYSFSQYYCFITIIDLTILRRKILHPVNFEAVTAHPQLLTLCDEVHTFVPYIHISTKYVCPLTWNLEQSRSEPTNNLSRIVTLPPCDKKWYVTNNCPTLQQTTLKERFL